MTFKKWLEEYQVDKPWWRGSFEPGPNGHYRARETCTEDTMDRMAWAWNAGVEAVLKVYIAKGGTMSTAHVRDTLKNKFDASGHLVDSSAPNPGIVDMEKRRP